MMKCEPHPIVVIVEHDNGKIRPVTYELLTFAANIRQCPAQRIMAVILGDSVEQPAEKIAQATGIPVWAASAKEFKFYNAEVYKHALHLLMAALQPAYVCIANSSCGSDFAPGLAVRLQAACITQVQGIRSTSDGVCFTRAILGGKLHLEVRPLTKTTVLTLQPGMMPPAVESDGLPGEVVLKKIHVPPQSSKTLAINAVRSDDLALADAKAVVSAGRGIGDETNMSLVHQLADCIPHAVVCGSRPVVDLGWLPYNRQVGVTGSTVSPALYVACGISGAEQHVSGMRTSGFIVSINKDPTAAIFHLSDVCIVEDLKTFIPAVISAIKSQKGTPES
jgi:electron transfer flavoprotein alpha subunit